MSEYGYDEDEFEETDEPTDLVKQLRKQLKTRDKSFAELEKKFSEINTQYSEYRLRDVLSEKGVQNQKVAKYLRLDGVDISDANAVDAWLAENGDDFGYTPPQKEGQAQAAQEQERIAVAAERGVPSSKQAEILAEIANASSPEEMASILARNADIRAG